MKRDHYALLGAGSRSPIPGAPNLRSVGRRRLYGTSQPNVEGLARALHWMGVTPGQGRCIWINLRAEAVLYVDGEPHNWRLRDQPLQNWAPGGDVESVEGALKASLQRAEVVRVHGEASNGDMFHHDLARPDIRTPREVYDGLRAAGYDVTLWRVGVVDEHRPAADAIDRIADVVRQSGDAAVVMNCHAGHGRTTTGLVLAAVLLDVASGSARPLHLQHAVHLHAREVITHAASAAEYRTLLKLVRQMQDGMHALCHADREVARVGRFVNLRRAAEDAIRSADATAQIREYLARYMVVIMFDDWVRQCADSGFTPPFSEWLRRHEGLELLVQTG